MSFKLYVPTRVLFGAGVLNGLHEQVMPGKKALLAISDGKSVRVNGALKRTEAELHQAGVETVLFDRIQANPLKSTIMSGAAAARENGCDFVVALGGGSVLDSGKIIAMMATNPGDLWDYVGSGSGKGLPLLNKPLPVVCITTTAGTGSEVDPYGVVTHDEKNEKTGCGGYDSLYPVISVVDPELMLTVPPKYTAYQGFDALLQATEVYISKCSNPMSDMVALTAIEAVGQHLAGAVRDGNDLDARERVAFGNTMSGIAMVTGSCTSEHSLEHAMSAYHQGLPHGAGLIMISKAYYKHFIEAHTCDSRFVRMAKALGMEDAKVPGDFITTLVRLQEACGVADLKMSDYGIRPDEFKTLAENARSTMGALFAADPVALSDEDCVSIYQKSYR
jgi:alcohol dehydrogenase